MDIELNKHLEIVPAVFGVPNISYISDKDQSESIYASLKAYHFETDCTDSTVVAILENIGVSFHTVNSILDGCHINSYSTTKLSEQGEHHQHIQFLDTVQSTLPSTNPLLQPDESIYCGPSKEMNKTTGWTKIKDAFVKATKMKSLKRITRNIFSDDKRN